jgi:hypothetical protein
MPYHLALFVATLFACGATSYTHYEEQAQAAAVAQAREAALADGTGDKARFAEAIHLYRDGQRSAAYGRFIQLADHGHAPSAGIALQMLRNGPYFYRSEWSATPAQVARWERTAGLSAPYKLALSAE